MRLLCMLRRLVLRVGLRARCLVCRLGLGGAGRLGFLLRLGGGLLRRGIRGSVDC